MIIFGTERLRVRQFETGDIDNFFLLQGDEEIMRYVRKPRTREQSDESFLTLLEDYKKRPGLGGWAVEEKSTGRFAGTFAIVPIPGQPEKIQMGYALLKVLWGKGYATELAKTGLNYAFNSLGLEVIYGVTEMLNIASQRVLLKAGFVDAGIFVENEKELLIFSIHNTKNTVSGSK